MMMAHQASLPGFQHMTSENRNFGELTEMPYGIIYPPVQMAFYLDNTMTVKHFFDAWTNQIFNRSTRMSGYYNTYVRDITITLLDKRDRNIYTVTLIEAYPKDIQEVQLSYDNKEIMSLNVTFNYKYWVPGDQNTDNPIEHDVEKRARNASYYG
jgi:hypothetical protein